jgi:hypothetical protein
LGAKPKNQRSQRSKRRRNLLKLQLQHLLLLQRSLLKNQPKPPRNRAGCQKGISGIIFIFKKLAPSL